MFLSGPLFGVWILHGNYSASRLLDTVPFSDPLMVLQSLASGHLCPTGALYGVLGCKSTLVVEAAERTRCTRCMDCFHVCPEPQVLRAPLLDKHSPVQVTDRDCITCGRCIDVCAEDVFKITLRWKSGTK